MWPKGALAGRALAGDRARRGGAVAGVDGAAAAEALGRRGPATWRRGGQRVAAAVMGLGGSARAWRAPSGGNVGTGHVSAPGWSRASAAGCPARTDNVRRGARGGSRVREGGDPGFSGRGYI